MADNTKVFYPTVTHKTIQYANPGAPGGKDSVDLPLVTLPPGTLLFRGFRLPAEKAMNTSKEVLDFYKDFLGESKDNKSVCLTPTHNTFFYPTPYVAFGIHGVGTQFNAMAVYVTTRPLTVISLMSPSKLVRGSGHAYGGQAPFMRCSEGIAMEHQCRTLQQYELKALGYDNCLNPKFAQASGVRGWMAIADLDSLEPGKLRKEGREAKDAPMSEFLKAFHDSSPRNAEVAKELLTMTYTDSHKHVGFPEIALYPYAEHPGPRLIRKKLGSEAFAQQRLASLASENNLNYLPVAAFTEERYIDFVNNLYNTDALQLNPGSIGAGIARQLKICTNLRGWMEQGFTEGLNLPFYGPGKISVDSRTGFFVLPQMIPQNLTLPIPRAIHEEEVKAATSKKIKIREAFVPYQRLCLPYDTLAAERRVMRYMMLFRTFLEPFYMKKYPKELTGLRRSFVFGRPIVLKDISTKIAIPLPKDVMKASGEAAGLYQKESGIAPKAKRNAAAAATAGRSPDHIQITSIPEGSADSDLRVAFASYNPLQVMFLSPTSALVRLSTPTAAEVAAATDRKVRVRGSIVNVAQAMVSSIPSNTGGHTPPLYGATTPPLYGATTPPYGAGTPVAYPSSPVFGGPVVAAAEGEEEEEEEKEEEEEGGHTPEGAPPAGGEEEGGHTPAGTPPGGRRKQGGGTRRLRRFRMQTRKAAKGDFAQRVANTFSNIWKIHGNNASKA